VFLLDIGLPGMSGYELATQLRALPTTVSSTFVALTGYGQSDDKQKSKAAGFDHHLTKPASMDELRAIIRNRGS
jgi:CheY-like chemotaxis protein